MRKVDVTMSEIQIAGSRGLGCGLISTIWDKRGSGVVQENRLRRNEIVGQNWFVPKLHDFVHVLRLLYLSSIEEMEPVG